MIPEVTSESLVFWHRGATGISGILLTALLCGAVYTDLRYRKIRNYLTYPVIVLGLMLNLALSGINSYVEPVSELSGPRVVLNDTISSSAYHGVLGGIGISESLLGGTLCFGGMCLQFLLFGTGAGDVKLMAALGVLLGWYSGLEIWLCTMILGAMFAVMILFVRVGYRSTLSLFFQNLGTLGTPVVAAMSESSEAAKRELKKRLPLAPFFAVSCMLVIAAPVMSRGEAFLTIVLKHL